MGNLFIITALILFSGLIVGAFCFLLALLSGVVTAFVSETKFSVHHSPDTIGPVIS
jgi:hypothetical protein